MKKRVKHAVPDLIASRPAALPRRKESAGASPSPARASRSKAPAVKASNYSVVLSEMKQLIAASRYRALSFVNRELVSLYWNIGRVIVEQQVNANWGDAIVEQLATDLRLAFPELKGFSGANVFQMRQFVVAVTEIDAWLRTSGMPRSADEDDTSLPPETVQTVSGLSQSDSGLPTGKIVQTPSGLSLPENFRSDLAELIFRLSWSQHSLILQRSQSAAERDFYTQMSVRERWSVRELRRQVDASLFERYVSAKHNPDKCLPIDAERGDLLPFKDHYVLEFLALSDEYSEQELRKAILANLRDFFLEFGKELTFVGEEYPLTIGGETFFIDLLFFHRRRLTPLAPALRGEGPGVRGGFEIDLKKGTFKPEHVGKSQFYIAALDQQIKLPHEKPSVGLVLCRSANSVQVKLALSAAAKKIGVATYETALPDLNLIRQRLEQFPNSSETDE